MRGAAEIWANSDGIIKEFAVVLVYPLSSGGRHLKMTGRNGG